MTCQAARANPGSAEMPVRMRPTIANDEIAMAADVRALIDRLDLLLMADTMSAPMKEVLVRILERVSDPEARAKLAIQLISISPEYSVLK